MEDRTTPEMLQHIMRAQAWERAKGAMNEVLVTYWDEYEKFESFERAMKEFVKYVQDNGWAE